MKALVTFITAIFVLAACATGDQKLASGGQAPAYTRPMRVIADITPEQVRDQLIAQCAARGYQLTSTEPSRILCERNAGVLASAFLQTGAGPPPRLQLHAVAIPHTGEHGSVVVMAWLSLQAYTWTGQPGMSESSMNQRQRAEVQAVLDGIRAPQSAGQ